MAVLTAAATHATAHEDCHVVVIGAGSTGLAAAKTLQRLNCTSVVLEARDEIGGRTHTVTQGPFSGVELGAHWVHGGLDNKVSAPLLSYLGIPIVPVGGNDDFEGNRRHFDIFDGPHVFNNSQRKEVFQLHQAVRRAATRYVDSVMDEDCDGSEACRAQDVDLEIAWTKAVASLDPPPSAEMLRAVDLMKRLELEQDGGNVPSKLGGRGLLLDDYTDFYPHDGHGDAFIEGGYVSVVRALAVGLDIRVSTPVTRVETTKVGVTVHTPDGSFSGTHVLVTPAAGVLSKIAFEPALPEWKSASFARMGQGQVAKALILLKEPLPLPEEASKLYTFARISAEEDIISMCVRSAAEHPQPTNFNFDRTLECFVGAGALAAMKDATLEEKREMAENQLQQSFGPDLQMAELQLTPWTEDPYIGLAWSCAPVGTVKQDFLDYAAPVDRVHFAGEGSCYLMWGNVHAALASASRAVYEMLPESRREAAAADDWPLLREEVRTACVVPIEGLTRRGKNGYGLVREVVV